MTHPTALITGASRGLGFALATALASNGWQLIITGRSADALSAAQSDLAALTSTPVLAISGDVADIAHRQALALVARDLGGLDLLVNNAGTLGVTPRPNLLDYDLDALSSVFRINTLAPLGLIQALCDSINDDATILNLTSDAAVEAWAGWGGYGASKAGLDQITAVLAAENPQWHIHQLDPGDMRTDMHQAAFPGEDISDRPLPTASVPGILHIIAAKLPSGRYAAQKMENAFA